MADVQGVNYAATFGATPEGKVASNINYGRMRVLYDTYEAAAAAAGTDVLIGKMQNGVAIHDAVIYNDAMGGGVTLSLVIRDAAGTEVVVTAAYDASTAGANRPVAADIANIPALTGGATLDGGEVDVIVKIAGGAATGTIKAQAFFAAD